MVNKETERVEEIRDLIRAKYPTRQFISWPEYVYLTSTICHEIIALSIYVEMPKELTKEV